MVVVVWMAFVLETVLRWLEWIWRRIVKVRRHLRRLEEARGAGRGELMRMGTSMSGMSDVRRDRGRRKRWHHWRAWRTGCCAAGPGAVGRLSRCVPWNLVRRLLLCTIATQMSLRTGAYEREAKRW